MDNASKNAGEMIGRLQTQYNRGRQAAITNELIDIITGSSFSFIFCVLSHTHVIFAQVQVLCEHFIYCADGGCTRLVALDYTLSRYPACSETDVAFQSLYTSN